MLDLTDIKPGDTLGRYEILMPVAHGGMAAVWAARMVGSRGFQKLVAVKTMLPTISDDPDFETMFLDEARLASRIHHPHVVEIVDLGDEHGWLYIVMEWVDGETIFTLNKRAKAKGGIPLPLLLRIASSACAGLHAAHELRDEKTGQLLDLVHRDISPQNVMVSSNGIVKLVDFGVAKAAGRGHNTVVKGVMKGKVPYGSPEQLASGKLDRRSDIFSLGILMYVMLSGLHPFKGESDAKTMENIITRAAVPLREIVRDVPADVEAIILRALEKDPAKRFPDCAAMQRAIDQALSALGTPVTDVDVGAFVKSMVGDILEERRQKLASAIQHADNAPAVLPTEGAASTRRTGARGGAPLPATFKGIIPVSLDDSPRAEAKPSPSAPKKNPEMTTTGSTTAPAVVATPRRRSALPYILLLLLVGVGGAAFAVRSGHLPWLLARLPPQVRDIIFYGQPAGPQPSPIATHPTEPLASSAPAMTPPPSSADAVDGGADPLDASATATTGDASLDGGGDAAATDAGDAGDAGDASPDGSVPPGGVAPRPSFGQPSPYR